MEKSRKTTIKPNRGTILSSLTNFAASHPKLITIGIYAGIVLTISAVMGFALYPQEQQAFAKAFVFYPE